MSVRPPSRSAPVPPAPAPIARAPEDSIDDLEELGDDAIISQQTEAHAPKPRVNVAEESRSIVITDHPLPFQPPPEAAPAKRTTEPPRRSSGEATLVIRDRRALDELRQNIVQHKSRKRKDRRSLYLWGGLGVVAFVLGGVVAALATDSGEAATQAAPSASAPPLAANPKPSPRVATPEPTKAVRLDDLPVEPPRKR